jgi:hypothetical protein
LSVIEARDRKKLITDPVLNKRIIIVDESDSALITYADGSVRYQDDDADAKNINTVLNYIAGKVGVSVLEKLVRDLEANRQRDAEQNRKLDIARLHLDIVRQSVSKQPQAQAQQQPAAPAAPPTGYTFSDPDVKARVDAAQNGLLAGWLAACNPPDDKACEIYYIHPQSGSLTYTPPGDDQEFITIVSGLPADYSAVLNKDDPTKVGRSRSIYYINKNGGAQSYDIPPFQPGPAKDTAETRKREVDAWDLKNADTLRRQANAAKSQELADANQSLVTDRLDSEWIAEIDDKSGKIYYCKTRDPKRTQYDYPGSNPKLDELRGFLPTGWTANMSGENIMYEDSALTTWDINTIPFTGSGNQGQAIAKAKEIQDEITEQKERAARDKERRDNPGLNWAEFDAALPAGPEWEVRVSTTGGTPFLYYYNKRLFTYSSLNRK